MIAATAAAAPDINLCPQGKQHPEPAPRVCTHPYIGILGVLLGSIISTLAGRITTFGLADIRGAVHAGFDEGAWISTAFTVGQMLIGPISVWLGGAFGPRRVLLVASSIYMLVCLLQPFSPNLATFITLYAIGGLSSGTFIPLTISFVLRNLPARLAVYGVSVYAMNSELSQNISASIEGWFADHWSWHWIFWQNLLFLPIMMLCIWFGIPREPVNRDHLRSADWFGLIYPSIGFSMIYAALDQGNRLDWLNSGLISGLLLGGCLLIIAFIVHEMICDRPWINLGYATSWNMLLLSVILIMFRFGVLSTALIIPQYLTTVQNFRSLETGDVLLWVALPQFILAPMIGKTLQHVDARIPMAIGFGIIGIACFMASGITKDWASDDFLSSQILQAIGQSFGFTSFVWFFAQHLKPGDAFTFGALIHTMRLFGGELGVAFVQTFIRTREQIHSNLIGLHVTTGAYLTDERISRYSAAVSSRSLGQPEAQARAFGLLGRAVQTQANVLAYVDSFVVIGLSMAVCLVFIALLRAPPGKK